MGLGYEQIMTTPVKTLQLISGAIKVQRYRTRLFWYYRIWKRFHEQNKERQKWL